MFSGQAAEPGGQDADWNKFFQRLTRVQSFKELAQGNHKEVKRLEVASRLSWGMCLEDRARLQKRLDELNLNTLKQVSALKSQLSMLTGQAGKSSAPSTAVTEHSIEFYEPLQYLSDTARELVLKIVEERLHNAHGPSEDAGEWQQKCEEAEERAQKAEEREAQLRAATRKLKQELDAAEERLEEMAVELRSAMAQVAQLQMDTARLEEEKAQLEERLAQQADRIEELEVENTRLTGENQRLEEEVATFREKLEALERELAAAKEELEKAQQEVERLEARVQELEEQVRTLEARLREALAELEAMRSRCKELEAKLAAAEKRAAEAEAEAAELRAELARRNNTRTRITQTEMIGEHIQELQAENQRLKNVVSDTVNKLEQHGLGDMAKDLFGGVTILKAKSCFQRLYDDALERGKRLQRLKEKHAAQSRPENETRFTTWDQELEEAVQIESAVRSEDEHFREHGRLRQTLPPPPVDTGPPPPKWWGTPRGPGGGVEKGRRASDGWRVVTTPRMLEAGPGKLARGATLGVLQSVDSSEESLGFGAHTSLVLQPPYPRTYGQRSARETVARQNTLPPLQA